MLLSWLPFLAGHDPPFSAPRNSLSKYHAAPHMYRPKYFSTADDTKMQADGRDPGNMAVHILSWLVLPSLFSQKRISTFYPIFLVERNTPIEQTSWPNLFSCFQGRVRSCSGGPHSAKRSRTVPAHFALMALTEDKVARYRQQLREQETPEPESPNAQELQDVWRHGNQRRPVPPNYSDNHKVDIVNLERQWI